MGDRLAVEFEMRALMEDGFGSAFGEQDGFALGILDQNGHHAAGKVEGDFVQLFVIRDKETPLIKASKMARSSRFLRPVWK